jgi:hypothetical protein
VDATTTNYDPSSEKKRKLLHQFLDEDEDDEHGCNTYIC